MPDNLSELPEQSKVIWAIRACTFGCYPNLPSKTEFFSSLFMIVIYNRLLPFGRRYAAINLLGILFIKKGVGLSPELINHEEIHTRQMLELLILPFYLAYLLEWLWHLIQYRDSYIAYLHISFEKEAYAHGNDLHYLSRRRHFAQWRRPSPRSRND